jgi:hypothetical protein
MKIIITQTGQTDNSFTANLQFGDRSTLYPCTVQDPFNEEEEKQLEWYFELRFVHLVDKKRWGR